MKRGVAKIVRSRREAENRRANAETVERESRILATTESDERKLGAHSGDSEGSERGIQGRERGRKQGVKE